MWRPEVRGGGVYGMYILRPLNAASVIYNKMIEYIKKTINAMLNIGENVKLLHFWS